MMAEANMVRTQIQLTEEQMKELRRLSAETGKSAAELIRIGLAQYLASARTMKAKDRIERALRVSGKFSSGSTDVSADHDRYLAEAFEQ